ncbi:MAG: methyltransferase domain-containing protein [Firmicutes bacterium]|nr:methyltransferase domain-containing protein [Bacillota bacterium]
MASYDKYYREKNYFGKPYTELIQFFKEYPNKGNILDLGCGQGRDALELAKLGYHVTGVDISTVGVNQMLEEANRLNLSVRGEVCDVYTYDHIHNYDFILLDSMLHFYPKDKVKETNFYNKILEDMKTGSLFCNLLLKSKKNESYIKSLVENNENTFEVVFDDYVQYIEANCEYHMFVIRKI